MEDRELASLLSLLLVSLLGFATMTIYFIHESNVEAEMFKQEQMEDSSIVDIYEDYVLEPERTLPYYQEAKTLRFLGLENKKLLFKKGKNTFKVERKVGTTFKVQDMTLKVMDVSKEGEKEELEYVSIQRVK